MSLDEYIEGWRSRRFDWSISNCCQFAAEWVLAAEGWNPLDGLEAIEDEAHAGALVARYGSLAAAVSSRLGREPISPLLAPVGALVLLPAGTNGSIGICNGRRAFVMTPEGVSAASMSLAIRAWRVGK